MENVAAAIEGLGSYDVEETRKALQFLVKQGSSSVVNYILPLTVHPDVAIRFFAKKAVKIIRSRPATVNEAMEQQQNEASGSSSVARKHQEALVSHDDSVSHPAQSHSVLSTTGNSTDVRQRRKITPAYARPLVVI